MQVTEVLYNDRCAEVIFFGFVGIFRHTIIKAILLRNTAMMYYFFAKNNNQNKYQYTHRNKIPWYLMF